MDLLPLDSFSFDLLPLYCCRWTVAVGLLRWTHCPGLVAGGVVAVGLIAVGLVAVRLLADGLGVRDSLPGTCCQGLVA